MNTKRTLLIVALFGAAQVAAFGQSANPAEATNAVPAAAISLTATNHHSIQASQKIEPGYSVPHDLLVEPRLSAKSRPETDRGMIRHWDGENSQAWILIASRQQNLTALHDACNQEPQFGLLWLGSPPWR